MSHPGTYKARIICAIPLERLHPSAGDGTSAPAIGDIVELDHGFTAPDGRGMGLVYCVGPSGNVRWAADVYDSEIQALPEQEMGGA
ncbi:hypothetical protein [Cognatilysobacter lacus]|uniref:Nitrogen fixation protein NifZ n=1 Tax=Cognatilysobacter lacus TaxID=1643323 RepID=A0A5D8YBA8_9GAMM|nr:hypothetical protein [Lysobacter lacus]TZF80048.1 hypothetical protein FW784_14135 [Lysobacter lacus]